MHVLNSMVEPVSSVTSKTKAQTLISDTCASLTAKSTSTGQTVENAMQGAGLAMNKTSITVSLAMIGCMIFMLQVLSVWKLVETAIIWASMNAMMETLQMVMAVTSGAM